MSTQMHCLEPVLSPTMRASIFHFTHTYGGLVKPIRAFVLRTILPTLIVAMSIGEAAIPDAKMPVTTSSKEALRYFLDGRTLVENLRFTDAIALFRKAVEKDSMFALGYFYLAQTAPTAKEFFSNLDKAIALAGRASSGEQLLIKGFRAGAFADPMTQRKLYQELVDLFPGDERAQTLLGISYFGQQDYAHAVEHLKKATEISPEYAPAYNQLGYAYRFQNQYPEAEATFKKYTQLLPDDPNPYDSYAELLLKMGRFEESIVQYRKALTVNSHFANSYAGIAAALMYQNKHDEARREIGHALEIARNSGEARAALFAAAVTFMDEGKPDMALKEVEKQHAIAEKDQDVAALAADCMVMGNILLESGKSDEALKMFKQSLSLMKSSKLAKDVIENAELISHYNMSRVAIVKGDLAMAKAESERFQGGAKAKMNQNQIRLYHELAGTIALQEKTFEKAAELLKEANQQDPVILYRLALAYQAAGRTAEARSYAEQAAKFNALPLLNYAYVRKKAERLAAAL
jgi:tetratricopeptide (TPR) repeat protein